MVVEMHDLYRDLGVNADASTDDIKKAFRRRALTDHPDKGGNAQIMALLTTTYQTLIDPIERKKFDQEWELFNASHDTEISLTPSDCLPTAGIAFSKSFRQQHAQFIGQCRQRPLDENQSSSYLKAFRSDLYSCSGDDLFSFIKAKSDFETKLDMALLTPEKAVEYFINFLRGDYSRNDLRGLSKAVYQKIKQLESFGQQAGYEFKLYCGIYEILLVAAKEKTPDAKILFSLHKVTEYAKHDADSTMSFMAPLLQNKYFRSLFSQALHYYWLSEESVLDESYVKSFNGQAAAEGLIERLKSKLSENRRAGKSNDQVAKLLRYARLLLKLEQDLSKSADTTSATFYREKAFHLLDWLPSIIGFIKNAITVNTLLQIGILMQKAAAQETNSVLCIADEKLAIQIYTTAVGVAHHATPDIELYAYLHSVKCLLSCRYTDSKLKEVLEAFQHRALWIADLFPFFQAPQPNADFIAQEDETTILMRQLLHTLIDKIEDQNDPAEKCTIDHSYVRVVYQAYEACLKNWYQKNHDPEREEKFRQRLMQELLVSRQWTIDDINYNLNAPWPLTDLDNQSWTCPKSSILTSGKKGNAPTYKTIRGVELNYKTGEINFILTYCKYYEKDYNRLLTPFDLKELFQRVLTSAIFSLDPVDSDMPYHPFNKMWFKPSTLYHSQLLHTMFVTDYLLKFLTVGVEVQRRDPYELRSLDKIMYKLPNHLKKVIYDVHASNHEESLNRFWIESEGVELAVDDEGLSEDGDILFALGNIRMVVKHHKMERDAEGKLVDKEGEDEGWDCYILTQEQKQELYNGKRIMEDSALIIIKGSWELIFWENQKATHRFTLEENKQDLIRLGKLQRDSQEKVKIDDSESLRQIYRIVLKAAKKTGMPNRYSPEFVFAQEFTKYYDEFAIYFPEFGRLRELSKAVSLVNVMAAQREANQEEVHLIRRRLNYKQFCGLQSKQPWQVKEHDYWQTTRQELKELVSKRITKQFEEWRSKFSKEKIQEKKQELINDLRRQIGTLNFTRSSPEIRKICDEYYNEIKKDVIAEHGYSGWSSVSHEVHREVIEPKIPGFIADLKAQKKAACHKQLLKLFEDELNELPGREASQLLDRFLEGNDSPLREHLVCYDRKLFAKKIKEVYPEHTIYSLDRALNNSLFAINEVGNCETEKALKEHEKQLGLQLSRREKLEQSFTNLGFSDDSEEVNLEGTCSWVPASFRHDVEGGHSRTVYGGVCIAGMVDRIIDRKLVKALARQTRKEGKQAIENKIRGTALNRYCDIYLTKLLSSDPRFKTKSDGYVKTDLGKRYLDLVVLKDGIPVQGIEIKAADSRYVRPDSFEAEIENKKPTKQGKKDYWIEKEREKKRKGKSFPIKLVRVEKLTKDCCEVQ
ncbi:curved DNA binding protein DnaJ [Nephila pilipes]|uniref:Curved DNA binding protein DnaJ n=1 Tax=Nephila pilipes TaxID=299642 RepID=A0A8X6PDA9_NEPPI|nr:curved DNA binding protein DnaJ [Nephila pilipes]